MHYFGIPSWIYNGNRWPHLSCIRRCHAWTKLKKNVNVKSKSSQRWLKSIAERNTIQKMAFDPNAKSYLITQPCVVVIAHLWKQKHFVQTAVFTAINQKWENELKLWCASAVLECCCIIHSQQFVIWLKASKKKENWRNRNEFKKDILDCARLR